MKVFVLVALLAGCTDAVTVTPGCGNLVLEPELGEACDAPTGCNACRITCSVNEDCPGDAVCGPADGVCHTPAGTFAMREVTARLNAFAFAVADVDADGIADVAGIGNGSVIQLFGDAALPLEASLVRNAPFASAPPTIADINGDGVIDVLIPSQGGIATFESSELAPSLEPVVFPFRVDANTVHARTGPLNAREVVRLSRAATGGKLTVASEGTALSVSKEACGQNLDVDANDQVIGRVFDPVTVAPGVHAFAFMVQRNTNHALCIDRLGDPSIVGAIAIGANIPEIGNVFLAEIDNNLTCPDVVYPVVVTDVGKSRIIRGTFTGGKCEYNPASAFDLTGNPLARVRRAGDTYDLLVTTAGIYDARATAVLVLAATRAWTAAVTGDFDSDGRQDFAVAGVADDVEVLEQQPLAGWRISRIPLAAPVRDLATGDFDGDGYGDLALLVPDGTSSQIYLSYGASLFSPPTLELAFAENVTDIAAADLIDPSVQLPTDLYDDLVITHGASPGKLSFVYGSANRQLAAPWRLDPQRAATKAKGIVVGGFGLDGAAGALALFEKTSAGTCNDDGQQLYRTVHTFERFTDVDTCAASAFLTDTRFVSVPFGDRHLVLGMDVVAFTSTDGTQTGNDNTPITVGCATFAFLETPTQGANLDLPVFDTVACADFSEGEPLANLEDVTVVPDRPTPTLLTARADKADPDKLRLVEWKLTLATVNGKEVPRLTEPVDLNELVEATLGSPVAACFDVAYLGGGKQQLIACRIEERAIRLFVRTVETGTVAMLPNEIEAQSLDIETGDVTGDGLPDIVCRGGQGGVRILVQEER